GRRPLHAPASRSARTPTQGCAAGEAIGRSRREVSLEHRCRSPYLPAATAGFVQAAGAATATGWPDPADALRGHSSVGRALEWHSRGRGFDSPWLHQSPDDPSGRVTVFPCRAERYSPGEAQDLVVAM